MHGCTSGLAPLVNAEVDSMGGVVDGGVAIGIKASPRRAAIEKAQAELRQEYDVREERRKELEYLEKGGNPLDFKLHNAASISVQSTSLADQHPEQFVTSEAKGSFALTASPRGDSVESIGRPGASTYCEPNSADNLLLFDGENEFIEVKIAPSKQSSQFDGSQNVKESGDSTALGVPKNQAYRRRNRSKPNRDGARSSSADKAQSRGGNVSSLLSRHVLKDAKGAGCEPNNLKDPNVSLNSDAKPLSNMVVKAAHSNNQLEMELDGVRAAESASRTTKEGLLEAASDIDPICLTSGGPESVGVAGSEHVISASIEPPCLATTKVEYQTSSVQQNGFSNMKGDVKGILNEGQNNNVAFGMKGLDSESSCTHTGLSLDEKNDSDLCTNLRNIDSNGMTKEHSLVIDGESHMEVEEMVKEKNEIKVDGNCAVVISGNSNQDSGSIPNVKEDLLGRGSSLQNEMKHQTNIEGIEVIEPYGISASEAERNPSKLLGDNFNPWKENACTRRRQVSVDSFVRELPETTLPVRCSAVVPEQQTSSGIHLKLANKAHEDNILEEARVIETKRKRIAELSVDTLPLENRRRSHWDFVLEEMAWLANDFAQERLWKITASAQICHRVAFASRLRFAGQNICWEHKKVAHTLAKAIMEFWHSAEKTSKEPELRCPEKKLALAVRAYAVRFLKTNHSNVPIGQAEVPVTPESMSDLGILEMSWEDRLTEENLFYTVLPGAMETYRTSIESYLVQCEKTSSSMQEEVETSVYDAVADLGSQEIAYEEDEGETGTYFTSEGTKSSKFTMKKRKNLTKSYVARSYELGADLALMQQSVLVGKRPTHTLNAGSIPTKRVRTASRLRVISPFSVGNSGCFQAPNKTDASSGDTNSFQDDQSTLHAGSQIRNNLEVESVGDFEKQLPFDSAEVSTKHRKKKKAKHLGSTYEPRWQLDSNFQNEQRDHSRKRFENHQLESNGSSGLFNMKKPKMMKQSLDNSFDNLTPIAGSIPSPVTSQMSNMSNPDKIIKLLGGRDRGRNAKALKMPAGQPESGSPWSLFEDQALVVLVHDMGPNWRLVSDAINSTLQLKCIFRKPKDCKERHKVLMDRTTGDGADSAEDSGSSQPYPSTLPGIPKGSARQLFQRLQGPMEEETLKSHFGKIIAIGQKLHYRRIQNGNQDIKQILPHNSHADALSQVCPNNLNGGPPLMPLDLCDATASSLDALSHGYQGSHPSGSSISSQGSVAISNQGSPGMVLGSNFSSPSGPISASVRDHIYSVSRTASSPIDEQQRMQQYKQILSGRNIQKSSLPVPGALPGTDRSVRMLPGGNSTGTACGVNRSMPMARPGYQGIASPPVMNSGSMLSSSNVGMPSAVNMHSGAGPGQGISMLRPRDTVHMMRPTQDLEHQRQMMVPELHMQATQANIQGVPGFGGLSSVFSSQTAPPPVQAYPVHHHHHHHHLLQGSNPNHAANAQHQAYAIRIAKDRHLHQRLMQQQQQQQQQFSVSNALMPHVQSPPQLPISPSLPNSSQIQSQTFSPPVTISPLTSSSSMTPMSQHPQKHQMLTQGPTRNPQSGGSGLNSQIGKQRQRQPQQQQFQQSGRHHPQQRQLTESQQQAKRLKGIGRGTSLPNGLSTIPGSQAVDKAEQVMHLMHGQGLYPGSGLNPVQSSKPLVSTTHSPNHSQPQQKIYPGQTVPSSKQLQQVPSRSDNGNQGHIGPTLMTSSNHQHPQLHQKLANQTQPAGQRVVQPNRPTGSDPPSKLQSDQAQTGNTTAMPQVCTDKINIIPVVSSASTPQCIAPEPLYDSGVSNSATQLGPTGNLTNSSGSEPPTPIRQGLGRRQSSGSLASSPQQQEQESSQHELPPQQQSQQQTQHLQAENSSLYLGPSDSKLE